MYRRNYMVKSQLRSLEDKSRNLNSKIDGETKIDEWAESYITRADAQIDDVSDYMQYRNLSSLQGLTDNLPQVGTINAIGVAGTLFLLGAGVGLVTYSEYRTSRSTLKGNLPRLKQAGIYGLIGATVGAGLTGIVAGGQRSGKY